MVCIFFDEVHHGEPLPASSNSTGVCFVSSQLWHNRLGHPADQVLVVLKEQLNLGNETCSPCEMCHMTKRTRERFSLSDHKSKFLGELVHLDVWGPYRVPIKEGFKYFLTFVDDYTRVVWVYLLKTKCDVSDYVISFYNLLGNQFGKFVKMFRSNNGTEFVNSNLGEFFKAKGVVHQTSCAHTPQQNGVLEHKHRHLLNVARSLMFQGGIPLNMWNECILTATSLINRTPSFVLGGRCPYELVYGFKPVLTHLRNFGCLSFVTRLNVTDN